MNVHISECAHKKERVMKREISLRSTSLPVEYIEKNSIARGAWACSPSTYKIISLACSLLSNGKSLDGYWVEFTMGETSLVH